MWNVSQKTSHNIVVLTYDNNVFRLIYSNIIMKPILSLKALVTRTHCCGHIVAHDVSWAAQTGKHLPRTQNVSEQNQKHFLCPQQMLRARANGKTFVSATMCPQQCVLVCQGLKSIVSSG